MPFNTQFTEQDLLRQIKDVKDNDAAQPFCFILGSGASVSSGIRSGNELAKIWFKELQEDGHQAWLNEEDITLENCGIFYKKLFARRFGVTAQQGNHFLQKEMEGKEPGLGYVILAHIMASSMHNLVITTNFDRMVEDALAYYTKKMPLVLGHETALNYAQNKFDRPTIVKLHRDILLSPLNRDDETGTLKEGWETSLDKILGHYCTIVLGYGGNDGSLMGYLEATKDAEDRQPVLWCERKQDKTPDKLKNALSDKDSLIKIDGFDEFMFKLAKIFDITLPQSEEEIGESTIVTEAKERARGIFNKFKELTEKLSEGREDDESKPLSDSVSALAGRNTWWAEQRKINKIDDKEITTKNRAYLDALQKLPDSHELHGNYANFLRVIKKDNSQAEKFYIKALELDPDHAINNGNYALFLHNVKKDYTQAEKFHKKALKLDPDNPITNNNYASFLKNIKKSDVQAEKLYKKALELDPDNPIINGNYARFLEKIKKDYAQAEEFYKKALKLDPEDADYHGNYASFLKNIKKDNVQAEKFYKKALELEPDDATNNGNYAIFLADIKKDYAQAEKFYKKALELDPEDADYHGNYANFLADIKKDIAQAEEFYKKALELDPEDFIHNSNYANFLMYIKKDMAQAEKFYKKNLKLNPDHPGVNSNYARFLEKIKKDNVQAEEFYKKALELDPDNADYHDNYASFLAKIKQDYTQADKFYKKALKLDPDDVTTNGNYGGFCFVNGQFELGRKILDKLFEQAGEIPPPLLLELWFYRLAHQPEHEKKARTEIKQLLKQGHQSIGWDFSAHIEQARLDGRENIEELITLSKQITELP